MARQPPLHSNWDPAILHSQDAPAADGDAEDVEGEVLEALKPLPAGWQCTTQRGQPFLQAQTAGVDRAQADAVVGHTEAAQDALHFVHAEHDGQGVFAVGAHQLERGPLPPERVLEEELDAA